METGSVGNSVRGHFLLRINVLIVLKNVLKRNISKQSLKHKISRKYALILRDQKNQSPFKIKKDNFVRKHNIKTTYLLHTY